MAVRNFTKKLKSAMPDTKKNKTTQDLISKDSFQNETFHQKKRLKFEH